MNVLLMRKVLLHVHLSRLKDNKISFNLIYNLLIFIKVFSEKSELEKVFTFFFLLSVHTRYPTNMTAHYMLQAVHCYLTKAQFSSVKKIKSSAFALQQDLIKIKT